MTQRIPVSSVQNIWSNAQRVDSSDMLLEQEHNNEAISGIIQDHFGSGVLLSNIQQAVLFDSNVLNAAQAALVAVNSFDGTGISPTLQPSDINSGNQLEIELVDSTVFGRLSVKVAIIGEAFDGTLQMDRLYFHRNGKQVTSKHYKTILALFFNDFFGNLNCSRAQGGRIIVRETASFELSRDPIMASQDVQPDIFWRDWKLPGINADLSSTIQAGIGPEFTVDTLQINTTGISNNVILAGDVTSQVGQKFLATTNNIQKITLLLGVNLETSHAITDIYDWSGDLLISIYPLQSTVSCPSDIVPTLAIDFDPSSQPLAQLSYNQASLQDIGYVLNDVLQPVDFVFSAAKISSPTGGIVPGNYYAITVKRVGVTTVGDILIGTGTNTSTTSRATLFSGVWVDIPDQSLWFQVWTDAAKLADGQGYDVGNGILIPKTITDSLTGATIDNQVRYFSLADTGSNVLNTGLIQAVATQSVSVQDERTGNNIFSQQQFTPLFSFVTTTNLNNLKNISEPLTIGALQDGNPKQNPVLTKTQLLPGLASNDIFCVVNPDADLLSLNLLGSKLYPNVLSSDSFRIFRTTFCIDGYGDVNADGYIDANDVTLASSLIGESLYFASTQTKIIDGYFTTLELLRADVNGDGYVTVEDADLIAQYAGKVISSFPAGSSFTHMNLEVQQSTGRYDGYFDCDGYVRLDGYLGQNLINSNILSPSSLIYDGYQLMPMIQKDPVFTTVPFPGVTYQIVAQPFWQPYCLYESSAIRLVPTTFSAPNAIVPHKTVMPSASSCVNHDRIIPANDPGRNDFFVPDNLFIGTGEILRSDGSNYKVDIEIGTIILELPAVPLVESSINIFQQLVSDRGDGWSGSGVGTPAMRYSDNSTVQPADLFLNKVRFSVSVMSYYPSLDGYSPIDGYGIIVDPIIGVHIDALTGILTLSIKDLEVDNVLLTLVTKLEIIVYLKKGGWNNSIMIIPPNQVQGLISH